MSMESRITMYDPILLIKMGWRIGGWWIHWKSEMKHHETRMKIIEWNKEHDYNATITECEDFITQLGDIPNDATHSGS
jgi:hypothetical protein